MGAAAVVAGIVALTRGKSVSDARSRTTSKGVPVTLSLDGAGKAWLAKNLAAQGFPDLSRAARMAIDFVAQDAAVAEVFTPARVAAKQSVRTRAPS